MTTKTSKRLLFVLIGILVVMSIWVFINRYLQRSRASTDDVAIRFNENSKTVNIDEEFSVEIWLEHASKKYSGATIGINYNKNSLQFIGTDNSDNNCNKFGIEIRLNDQSISSDTNSIIWTKVSSQSDASLPTGLACFGKLKFRASNNGSLTIADPASSEFEIVGPNGTYNPVKNQNYSKLDITIAGARNTSPLPPITVSSSLSATSSPSNCPLESRGDADCDNSIDNTDYNIWKCEYKGNGTCSSPSSYNSANFDVKAGVNIIDFEIWRRNNLE